MQIVYDAMVEMVNDKKVLERVSSYFEMLRNTGYVKAGTTSKYLLYIFLFDFVDTLYDYITEEDYEKINLLLRSIFSSGDCLLPYRTSDVNAAKIVTPHYHGYAEKPSFASNVNCNS